MATHSSTFSWKIPWTEEPGRLQCMESPRVSHDWATSLSFFPSFWKIAGFIISLVLYYFWLCWIFLLPGCSSHCREQGPLSLSVLGSLIAGASLALWAKVYLVKAVAFPVVMYGCESWTIKKAEHQRIDAFELWCWGRLLRVPWTTRRSNQSLLKDISPGCSLEGLMLKLKLQYFGHLMWRSDSFEKTLMLGKIEGEIGGEGDNRGWDGWMASLTRWI